MQNAGRTLTLLLSTIVSCAPDFDDPEYTTPHTRIRTSPSLALCAGDLAEIEAYIESVEKSLGVEMVEPVNVLLWDDISPPESVPCPNDFRACYIQADHTVYAGFSTLHHELVHAIVSEVGRPRPYFSEGIATGLDVHIVIFPGVDPRTQLGLGTQEVSYSSGAHFTRWLLDAFGTGKWRQLYSKGGSARDFRRVYGMSFDHAVDEYLSTAPWIYAPLFLWQVPQLLSEGGGWRDTVEFNCEHDDTLGRNNSLAVVRRLVVPEEGYYDIWTTADSLLLTRSLSMTIDSMEGVIESMGSDLPVTTDESPLGGIIVVHPETLTLVQLDPGTYEVALIDADRDTAQAEVIVTSHFGPIEVPARSL